MNRTENTDGWPEWSKYVLKELERLNVCYNEIGKDLRKIDRKIVTLEVKAGFWGVLGGLVPVVIMIGIIIIKGLL